jgi:heme/copper-type cytochrome/quinol oxidase subunit 2
MRHYFFSVPAIVLAAILVSGCTKQTSQTTANPGVAVTAAPAQETVLAFTIKAGQVTPPSSLTVTQGATVVVRVTADISDEVHLHGYDLKTDVASSAPAEIRFTANIAGRFEIELENAKQTLGELIVQPK